MEVASVVGRHQLELIVQKEKTNVLVIFEYSHQNLGVLPLIVVVSGECHQLP